MKTLTQIVLPIAAIAGLVFGITYIANYSSTDPKKGGDVKHGAQTEALKFPLTTVQSNPNDWRTRYWHSDFEVGEHGGFDFWLRNLSDQPVRFAFIDASCTCAGTDVGIVPPDAMSSYLIQKASAQWPGLPGGPILDALSLLALKDRIQWKNIAADGHKGEASIPGATLANPQFAIVRLKWEAKEQQGAQPDAPVRITANFVTQLPNATAAALHLEAMYSVVQPLHVYVPGGRSGEIRLGDLFAGTTITRELICWSKTRSELPLILDFVTPGDYRDCAVLTEPKRLTENEVVELEKRLSTPEQPPLKIKSAYRVFLTVYEQREIERNGKKSSRQLDLGPLTFQLQVALEGATKIKPVTQMVHGMVRGDVRMLSDSGSTDAVDFGTSFPSNETRTSKINIIGQRSGLELELVRAERTPDYLEVELLPDGEKDGNKHWILKVTIPAKTLFGDLPQNSQVILQTKDATPRRVRIPVRAKTFDGGSR